jgi:hypothetical protein
MSDGLIGRVPSFEGGMAGYRIEIEAPRDAAK